MFTEQLTQALSIPAASLFPANVTFSNTVPQIVGPIDMSRFHRAMAHVMAGVLGSSANVQAYWQASNVSGSGFTNVASGPLLLLDTTNTEGTLEIRGDQMPAGTRYLQLAVLVSTANSNVAATIFGGEGEYKPNNQYDYTALPATKRLVASI